MLNTLYTWLSYSLLNQHSFFFSRPGYGIVAMVIHCLAVVMVAYGMVTVYRIPYFITVVLLLIVSSQIVHTFFLNPQPKSKSEWELSLFCTLFGHLIYIIILQSDIGERACHSWSGCLLSIIHSLCHLFWIKKKVT